ncbi:MAG: hypothetical protein E7400_01670 [Ruminococcaceae bacterium]|nr:hypothetical protein [Oscillospiraceae bacterium]
MVLKSKRMVRLISLALCLGMMLASLPVAGVTAEDIASQIPTKETAGATFRLGVISDSHLDPVVAETKLTAKNMTLALQTMQALEVDALAMNGDMVYAPSGEVPENLYDALKGFIDANETFTLAGTMNADGVTFEADTTSGKKPIIYSMGNHEFPLNASVSTASALVTESKERFATETGRQPGHVMKVNGYTFIVGEPADYLLDYTDAEEFVMAQILEAEKDGTNKPIFYLQHEAVYGTVIESPSAASDNTETFKNFLKEHPRVVVFSGHSHAIIEDPRSIWQDGFTAIATSQVGGGSVSGGSAKYSMGAANTGSQCIMLDMTEKADATDVSAYRLNLLTGQVIGTPFTFTINGTSDNSTPANETFKYTEARYDADISIANFSNDAAITVTRDSRQSFAFKYNTTDASVTSGDDAAWLQDAYVHAYQVVLKNTDKNVIEQNFKVFGDIYEEESSRAASCSVTLPNALNLDTNYAVSVYALTPFTTNLSVSALEAKGITPVTKTFKTAADLTDAEKASIAENGGINVALNKTVYSSVPNYSSKTLVNGQYNDKVNPLSSYPADSEVSLPSGETIAGAKNNGEDWYMIDLGRRYNLAKIKVWPNNTVSGHLQKFAVQVSNTEDFSSYVSLGTITVDTDNTKPFVFNGDSNAWRYVRLAKTAVAYYTVSELEVFAAVKTADDLIGPKVMNATRVNDNTISVSFAHKMDADTVTAVGALKVVQDGGATITPSSVTLSGADEWDGGYDATLTFATALPANGLTLVVDGDVGTMDGTTFVDDLNVPIAGKALTINKSYSKTRENVNVALNKPIYASNTGCPTTGNYAVSKLVDGSTTGFVAPADAYNTDKVTLPSGAKADPSTSQANDWYMIDLGRRYEVSSVVVHPAADKPAANYWGFVIEGSNDETFANSVPLGEVKVNDANIDGSTAVTFNGDGGAYRYIRLRKTANTYYLYSEIEVFANMTITDVARGKATEWGDAYSTLTGDKAVDGSTSTAWRLSGLTSSVTNLVVDLGAEYPVEMAQMYRASSYTDKAYTKFNVYGYSAAAGKPAKTGTPANPTATLFTTAGLSASSQYFDFVQGNYQYLALSKPNKTALALAEFKAFVVNPVAYGAEAKNGKLTVSFTDKMETSTLVASNFSIDGVTLSDPVVSTGWDGGYDVTFNYTGTIADGAELTISDKVRNQNGIEMAAEKTLTVKADLYTIEQDGANVAAPVAGTACSITANFIPKANATVIMYVAVKTTDGVLVSCTPSLATPVTLGELATVTIENVTPKTGEKLCLFLWENGALKPLYESQEINAK